MQQKLEGFNASHPFWGSLLSGTLIGMWTWVLFGLWSHALNLFAFELWMGMGLLFMGPLIVVFARRKRRPPTRPNRHDSN